MLIFVVMRKSKVAGGVVINKVGKVLVVNQNGDSWSLPKGHVDFGETALETAKREIYEESGVKDLVLIRPLLTYKRFKLGLDGKDDKSELKEIEMFLFRTDYEGELKPIDPGNPEAVWLSRKEVADLLSHPKDKEFFGKISYEL